MAILPQPNWRDDLRDFKKLGAPRLFFGVTAGCMDSMINRYTAARKPRSEDDIVEIVKESIEPIKDSLGLTATRPAEALVFDLN